MNKIKIAIFSTLTSIGLHSYLTWTFYPIKFAQSSGDSLCNINAVLNCDAVAASQFSTLFGIPMSVWGTLTNLVLLLLLLNLGLNLTEKRELTKRHAFFLSLFIAFVSLIMGGISLAFLGTYCLFCIFTYICSFITLAALWSSFEKSPMPYLGKDITTIFGEGKTTLILLMGIPLMSYVIHYAIISNYGAEKIDKIVKISINQWLGSDSSSFEATPAFSAGPEVNNTKMIIAEFADYLCPHCKHAAPSLSAFVHSHKDVRFEFYNFPLEGNCNSLIQRQGNGVRCFLAKFTLCAEKSKKGLEAYHEIFDHQEDFSRASNIEVASQQIQKISLKLGLNWQEVTKCVQSEESAKLVEAQAQAGNKAGVQGTPTIYVNGKILPRGQLIPVLEGVYKEINK